MPGELIELRTLGTLQLRGPDGRPGQLLRRSKRLALLVYLAADRPFGPKRRETLLSMFWPDVDPDHGRGALRQALQTLGDALGEGALTGRGTDSVGVDAARLWCDAAALDRAGDAGRHAEASRLFTGDFLPGLTVADAPEFEAWAQQTRTRLRGRAVISAGALADEAIGAEDLEAGARWCERGLELAPDDEQLLLRGLRVLTRLDRRARASELYEGFRERLRRDLQTDVSVETRAAADALLRSSVPGARLERPPGIWRASVAVLPFSNLSGDPDFEYFCEGITEELIADLATLPNLLVVARTSSFAFRHQNVDLRTVGRRLGVAHLVEGSVRRRGESVRTTVQLIDAGTGFHLWADSFDQPLAEALRMPAELVRRIAPALQGFLSGSVARPASRRTLDRDAFLLFLRGRYHLYKRSPRDLERAVALFESARERDPRYAAAAGGLALALATLPVYCDTPTERCLPRALQVADEALSLDQEVSDAHLARSLCLAMFHWKWAEARASLLRALQTASDDPVVRSIYAFYDLARDGRFEQAIAEARRARDEDPLSLPAHAYLGYVAYLARQHDLAEEAARAALELQGNFPLAQWVLEMTLEELGRLDEAVEVARTLVENAPGPMFRAHLARALARAGRPDARQQIEALTSALSPRSPVWYWVAGAVGSLGAVEEGLDRLEQAVEARSNFLIFAAVHPTMDPFRGHPRFEAILRRLGLRGDASITARQ